MNMIWSESHRLDTYIQNLLDMTRLENGALRIERDWVSVNDLVGSAMGRLKRYFPGVQLEYHTVAEPPLLYVNPALLEQALFNIIENAVKYSPPDAAVVINVDSDASHCRIAVEDRGPGIPEALLEKVFDMFYVIGEGDHRKHGTGVGLAICRGMITAQNGRVWAEQRDKGGTRFVVELPLLYPDPMQQEFSEDEQ
jgi:two-component system sensor histidine kinase KdpD